MTVPRRSTGTPSPAAVWNALGCRGASLAAATFVFAVAGASDTFAHPLNIPIAAKKVAFKIGGNAKKQQLVFKAKDPNISTAISNPIEDGSALLVVAGGGSGRTQLIELDPSRWKSAQGGLVFKYTDKTGSRGGVKKIVLKPGALTIKAGGPNLQWAGTTDLSTLWVLFRVEQEWHCALTSGKTKNQKGAGAYTAKASSPPTACLQPICGNAEAELGEDCDDGNLSNADACKMDCEGASTFDAIQRVIFDSEAYGCTNAACHGGSNPQGGLDLTAGAAYASLMGPDGKGAPATNALGSNVTRVVPSEPAQSFLYHKLARKTLPGGGSTWVTGPYIGGGTEMPSSTPAALTEDHLEAIARWIRGGAPEDRVVEGTAELLGAELAEPEPLLIPVPDPPAAGTGVQLQQTAWPLLADGEDEVCMATYYDVTNLIPDEARIPCPPPFQRRKGCANDAGRACETDADCEASTCIYVKNGTNDPEECFAWNRQILYQDPQSHHSIIHIYTGRSGVDDEHWGSWTYKFRDQGQPTDGQPCDPLAIDPALGFNPNCSGAVVSKAACLGYGPDDYTNFGGLDPGQLAGAGGGNSPSFSGSQEPFYEQKLVAGNYVVLPTKGIIVWNSHAFNLTDFDSTMNQYLNLYFTADQRWPTEQIFDASSIFVQNVPPFETREYCKTYTLPRGARLFQMTSHTHRFGVLFRVWGPPQTPCRPACPQNFAGAIGCDADPALPICDPNDAGARDPAKLMYRSTEYTDPLQLEFDPPIVHDSANREDRTYLYCSVYDNGSTPDSPQVKRNSTTFPVPPIFRQGVENLVPGGPCTAAELACVDGPNKGTLCGGDNANCAGSECDACPVQGGVTTEDEMYILLGLYYVPN
jgi:cysteine-rich repeat protein